MIEQLFTFHILYFRAIRSVYQPEIDFTDHAYQMQLPIHARSTATQAVKSNLKITELMADQNLILGQQKVIFIAFDKICS